jgi:hypothetical protein
MKRSAAYVCGVIATVAGFSQVVTACNTIGDVGPTDASAPDVMHADAAPPACGTDPPPVMTILNANGDPDTADFSCYDSDGGDAAVLFPLDLDAGDALLDVGLDLGLPDVLPPLDSGDDGTTADAAMDAGPDSSVEAGDAGTESTFHLTEFVSQKALAGADVSLFFHNDPLATADFMGTTNANGDFQFPTPSPGVMAYTVKASTDLKAFAWLDLATPKPGTKLPAQGVAVQSFNLLANSLTNNGAIAIDPTKMILVVGVRDCQFRDVAGGVVEIFDDTTGMPLVSGEQGAGHDDYRAAYFSPMGFPDQACTHTSTPQSLFTALNVPLDHPLTARASGRRTAADTTPVVLGERKLPVLPNMIVAVRPTKIYRP